jgi:hypothetical protein
MDNLIKNLYTKDWEHRYFFIKLYLFFILVFKNNSLNNLNSYI